MPNLQNSAIHIKVLYLNIKYIYYSCHVLPNYVVINVNMIVLYSIRKINIKMIILDYFFMFVVYVIYIIYK